MDYQGALKFLGLNESASSEDMVRAKNQMISRYQEEEEKLKKVSICIAETMSCVPETLLGSLRHWSV